MKKMLLNIQMFASTNKTENYALSQYVGTDKPTYLGDYNSDMFKIDTAMKENQTAASVAKTTADAALENANQAQTTATTADTTANTANNTANSALEKSLQNENQILQNSLNLNNVINITPSMITKTVDSGNFNNLQTNAKLLYNDSKTLFKLVGYITFNQTSTTGIWLNINLGSNILELTETTRISFVALGRNATAVNSGDLVQIWNAIFNTDGTIRLEGYTGGTTGAKYIDFTQSLYINSNWNTTLPDIPSN